MSPPPTRSCMHAFSFSWLSRAAIRGNRRQAGSQLFPGRYCAPKWGESELPGVRPWAGDCQGADAPPRLHAHEPNRSGIRLLSAVAFTPCCSAIGPLPEEIPPRGAAKVPVAFRPGDGSGPRRVQFLVAANGSQGNYALGLRACLSGLGDSGSERPYHHVPDEPR